MRCVRHIISCLGVRCAVKINFFVGSCLVDCSLKGLIAIDAHLANILLRKTILRIVYIYIYVFLFHCIFNYSRFSNYTVFVIYRGPFFARLSLTHNVGQDEEILLFEAQVKRGKQGCKTIPILSIKL